MAAGKVEVTDEWRADLTDLIKPRSGQCRYQAGSCEQNDVPWRLQSAPISAENVVTIGTQIRRINPQGAPRLQDAAYFVQASDWIVQMFDGMTHGHRSEAGCAGGRSGRGCGRDELRADLLSYRAMLA